MIDSILENARQIAIETQNQIGLTRRLLLKSNSDLFEKIIDRYDYINNLNTQIENACFTAISQIDANFSKQERVLIRATLFISIKLEELAGCCVNIIRKTRTLSEGGALPPTDFDGLLEVIHDSLPLILQVMAQRNLSDAVKICKRELMN